MRREVYEDEKNEIEQQFAQHNLDRDMAKAYEASTRITPKEHGRKLWAESRGLIVLLVVVLSVMGLLVWLS